MRHVDNVRRAGAAALVSLVVAAAAAAPVAHAQGADTTTPWAEVPDPGPADLPGEHAGIGRAVASDVPYVPGGDLGCPGPGSDESCGGSQTLDVHKAPGIGPNPVVVWAHSGGWIVGDKSERHGFLSRVADLGFDVVTVNYRHEPFPVPVHDVKAAVRWVKANADAYGFAADSVVAAGHSAGGHLMQMVATTAGVDELEPPTLTAAQHAETSRVAAVVSLAAMGDLRTFLSDGHVWADPLTEAFVGCSHDCPADVLARASATTYASADDAPVYAITGASDLLALPHTTDLLGAAYARAGIAARVTDDAVDSGPAACQGHDPWCGTNRRALDEFVTGSHVPAAHAAVNRFTDRAYLDFLGRQPAAPEVAGWRPAVLTPVGRKAFLRALAYGDEWVGTLVDGYYASTLGRAADPAGRAYWTSAVRAGMTPVHVAGHFYSSPEYLRRSGGTVSGWVASLYEELLGRAADDAGLRYWQGAASSLGRHAVTVPFYQSAESRSRRVEDLYHRLLGRAPDAAGLRYWSDVILSSGNDVDLAVALAGSDEYFLRAQR